MQRTIILAFLVARAFGTKCEAGYKHKADLANLHCSDSKTDAASCSSSCCEVDKKKCGGLSVTCPSDKYSASTDAWKNTKATEKTKLTDCCTEKTSCGMAAYKCPAAQKKAFTTFTTYDAKAWHAKKCPGGPDSCGGACCIVDTDTCGEDATTKVSAAAVCSAAGGAAATTDPQYSIGGQTFAENANPGDDVWKKIKITTPKTAATRKSACCGVKATCGSKLYSCPAGQKRVTANAATYCTRDASTCAATAACCVADTATCGGSAVTCSVANHYNPGSATGLNSASWKSRKVSGDVNVKCCTTQATCKDAVCRSGYKKKANVDKNYCPTNRDSCTGTGCCEKDTTKCGGVVQVIQCAYGYYDESTLFVFNEKDSSKNTPQATVDAWNNRDTTEGTRNTDCCTPKAVCEYEAPGTTTPAAVATTTPVYIGAVRRYSEHMVAVQKGSDQPRGASMVWLGVGGLIGMGVLMAVQGLRSRMPAPALE